MVANLWAQYVTSGTCGENLTWSYNDGVLTISGTGAMDDYYTHAPWDMYKTSINEIILPNGLTTIGSYAFRGCSGITSINIPNSVTSIGSWAFRGCSGLTSIFIPNGVTNISRIMNPFQSCSSLSMINVESGNPTYDSRDNCNAIIETNTNRLISGCKNTIIPYGVTIIGYYAFYGCSDLTSIVIPNSVTSIGDNAFSNTGITSITIPYSVTDIGSFDNCTNLTSIIWNAKNYQKEISSNTLAPFYKIRTNITSVVLGDSVQIVPDYLFRGMSNISSLSIGTNVPNINSSLFSDCTNLASVIWNVKNFPDLSSKYQTPLGILKANITSFTFGDSVQHIPAYLCCEMNNLDSITIPNSVTIVGDNSFEGCAGLTNVSIGNGVTDIGEAAFKECTSLTSITIPNSVNKIENLAFAGCLGLTTVNFADSIPPIIASTGCFLNTTCNFFIPNENLFAIETAFNDSIYNNYTIEGSRFFLLNAKKYGTCGPNLSWSLSKKGVLIVIGTGQMNNYTEERLIGTQFRSSAPWWGDGVKSVILDDRATSIGDYAFYDCYLITSINFPNNINSIGRCAFFNCYRLVSIYMPDSVTSIEYKAFYKCSRLESVTIGSGVNSIGNFAFSKCSRLSSFYCKGIVPPVVGAIFQDDYTLTNITPSIFVPCGSLKAYKIAWSYYANAIQYEPSNVTGNPAVEGTGKVNVPSICEDSIVAIPIYGYHFVQWDDGNTDNPRIVDIMEEATYTAIFEINVYKVDFVDWDNTILDSQQVNHGESAIAPEAPTREGWEFVGWDKNFSSVEDNMTIHAQYEAISGIENMPEHNFRVHKIFENGQLFILLPNGTRYDSTGKRVE